MRKIEGGYIHDDGRLYLERPGPIDPFDPPGTVPAPVMLPTPYTYEDVPTYGWPLGVIYGNNPLQFASEDTAKRMLAQVAALFTGYQFRITLDEVTVGPFRRAPIRQIACSDAGGLLAKLNAGEMASQRARHPDGWQAQIARTLRDGAKARDAE